MNLASTRATLVLTFVALAPAPAGAETPSLRGALAVGSVHGAWACTPGGGESTRLEPPGFFVDFGLAGVFTTGGIALDAVTNVLTPIRGHGDWERVGRRGLFTSRERIELAERFANSDVAARTTFIARADGRLAFVRESWFESAAPRDGVVDVLVGSCSRIRWEDS